MEAKFLQCLTCGNIICKVVDSGVTPKCCDSFMRLLEPKTNEVGVEKHLPVVTRLDSCTIQVKVGSTPHPSTPEHHIVFIALLTKNGIQIKPVTQDGNNPEITFNCPQGEALAVYSFCNLHGLWMTNFSD
ncbi:MAG: desulfoferrodoxin [Paludibacteraceae bacterium]|nr:desulfoferrodoxin [Paludibacteraceae bacterium]